MTRALLGAVLAMAGCVSTQVPPVDRRVTIAEEIGNNVVVTDVRCTKGTGEYLTFQANVVNNTSCDYGVEWKVVWLDADGLQIESLVSSWNKLMVSANDVVGLTGTASQREAADMRFYVRRLR